ncbi:uncharacterized protein LOC141719973 [Apium graveolens]|uniref:uncharacterized protein LOC141719973 n=1 Tax=Apium graveolens TaxID=4045 RepID=UPI003D79C3EA
MLSNPKAGEVPILFLAVSDFSVSAVLVREEGDVQLPVYYVSKRLANTETQYTNLKKLAYALILASRKLRPCFQAHMIEVRTSYPLRKMMHKPEASGRMLKWTIELGQFKVEYKHRTAIKGLALADFILEFPPHQEKVQGAIIVIPGAEESEQGKENFALWWSLFVDGASKGEGAGAGIELIIHEGHKIRHATHLAFHATNNDVNGGYQAKGPRTGLYLKYAQRIISMFHEVRLELIPRGQNEGTDELAKLGSRHEATLLGAISLDIQR